MAPPWASMLCGGLSSRNVTIYETILLPQSGHCRGLRLTWEWAYLVRSDAVQVEVWVPCGWVQGVLLKIFVDVLRGCLR